MTRRQLLALGFTHKAIVHRVSTGRLNPVARGVHAVGWPDRDAGEAEVDGARFHRGPGAVLSHRSAGGSGWGIAAERAVACLKVSVPGSGRQIES